MNAALLSHLMDDPYLRQAPPKTTGRERYGAPYVDALMQTAAAMGVPPLDILATVTRFTAESIAYGLMRFSSVMPARLIVGGGGASLATLFLGS